MAENSEKWRKAALKYLSYIRLEKHLAPNTVEAYMRDIEDFAHFILAVYDVAPTEVDAEMIEQFLARMYDTAHTASSQARVLSGIKSFYGYLMLTDKIEQMPTEFVASPKFGRPLPDTLTVSEVERIINIIPPTTVKGRRDRAMLELLYSCGLRVSELTALRVGDLFFGEGYIRVQGKGDKQRLVPIGSVAREKVMLYLDDRQDGATRSADILFLNNRGKALSRIMIFNIIRNAVAMAGIDKEISPHTFRHSFATHLLAGGASIRQIQELLGHKSIITTEIYTHLDADRLRDTVEKLSL